MAIAGKSHKDHRKICRNITRISQDNHRKIARQSQKNRKNITGTSNRNHRNSTQQSQENHTNITGSSHKSRKDPPSDHGRSQKYHRNDHSHNHRNKYISPSRVCRPRAIINLTLNSTFKPSWTCVNSTLNPAFQIL